MRIFAITPLYPPHSRVGAWMATHEALAHAVRAGHVVDVATYHPTSQPEPFDHEGVHVHPPTEDIEAQVLAADVVVSHLGDHQRGRHIADAYGKPSVRMVHGHVDNSAKLLAGDALAVYNSQASRDAIGWGGPGIVVHPATWAEDWAGEPTGDMVTLVNCAADKGGDVFGLIAASVPERCFLGVLGGYGRQVQPRGRNVVTQPRTADMRRDVHDRTSILLMPSLRETWGMAGVEAMHRGIPVIASPTPGLIESLGDAGIFVQRKDIRGWAQAVRVLSDPDNYAVASAKAKARAAELDPVPGLDLFVRTLEEIGA